MFLTEIYSWSQTSAKKIEILQHGRGRIRVAQRRVGSD